MKPSAPSLAPYTRHEVIGRGSYGIVYKGVHDTTKHTVAIKVLNLDTAEDEVADIQKEIVLLQSLKAGDAQNVVRYHGSFLNGTRLWIIMDYCEGGSIRTLMKSGRIEEKFISIIVREVLAALNYIHKADIIHRDVKAANILVTNDGRVQLCDFGVAAQLAANHFKRNTFVGTPYWMAPEVITDGLSYNFKADIWSLGITIYEIATGNPPYADQEPMRAIFLIPRNSPSRLEGAIFSPQMKEFLGMCLCERPEDRLGAAELLKSRWLKNIAKTPTSALRELIARYETWRKNGGVRKSLAMGGNLDANDEFDGQFGLDDEPETVPEGWDFGTYRPHISMEISQSTWEQSADATEDLLRTIRPTLTQSLSATGSVPGTRPEHPLMKLFGEDRTGQLKTQGNQSMIELSTSRSPDDSEPSTPLSEIVTIEMPALHATSLLSASSISLPALPVTQTPQGPHSRPGKFEMAAKYGSRDPRPLYGNPSRQNSSDILGDSHSRVPDAHNTKTYAAESSEIMPPLRPSDSNDDSGSTSTVRTPWPSPPKSSANASSPILSRASSPIRSVVPNPLSPPSSPSRTGLYGSGLVSSTSLAPKIGFNAGLNLSHMHLNGVTQALPDILPRPSISSGSSRDRSMSSSAIPMLPKQHIKKSSHLVLQLPNLLDNADNTYLPPSPSRAINGANGITTQLHTSSILNQELKATRPLLSSIAVKEKIQSEKAVAAMPELTPLDLNVLQHKDDKAVVAELTRVVAEMLKQLSHVESGLSSMTLPP